MKERRRDLILQVVSALILLTGAVLLIITILGQRKALLPAALICAILGNGINWLRKQPERGNRQK